MPATSRPPAAPGDGARRLVDADRAGEHVEDLSLVDTELVRCNLANVRAPRIRATRVVVEQSRLTGIACNEGRLTDVLLRGCSADLASFGFSGLERVAFEDCVLTHADFLEARLSAVRFHRCRLDGADFRGARLTSVEFRGCSLEGVVGVESLRGAAMEWPDIVALAGTFAGALGIEVLDDG